MVNMPLIRPAISEGGYVARGGGVGWPAIKDGFLKNGTFFLETPLNWYTIVAIKKCTNKDTLCTDKDYMDVM